MLFDGSGPSASDGTLLPPGAGHGGVGYGAGGGGGGLEQNSSVAYSGGNGAPGFVYIEWD